MKKILVIIAIAAATACNNSDNQNETELKDPTEVQPVSDAIPDSMKLVNDSTIVPNVSGSSDSANRNRR